MLPFLRAVAYMNACEPLKWLVFCWQYLRQNHLNQQISQIGDRAKVENRPMPMNPAIGSVAGKPSIFSFLIPKCKPWDISSYDLIDFMCQKEKDPGQAEKACLELYRRSAPLLLAAAKKWEYLGAKYDGELLVSETLLRAYRKANTCTRTPQSDREKEDQRVLFWLFTILKNQIIDHRGSFKTPVCWGLFLVCLNGKAGGTSVFHA